MSSKQSVARRIRNRFWPTANLSEDDAQKQFIRSMKEAVKQGDWSTDADAALDEARRLFDAESERRSSADSRAGIYLAAITALVPVLTSLLPNLWGDKVHIALGVISLLAFGVSVMYLVRAGWWAFKTLQVSVTYQIGPDDIAASWQTPNPKQELAKRLTHAVISNYSKVNNKILFIKMTHEYLLRAFISFALLLSIQAVWPMGVSLVDAALEHINPGAKALYIMCFA